MWTRWYSGARFEIVKIFASTSFTKCHKRKHMWRCLSGQSKNRSHIVPIFKSGDSEIPLNYRPISVLKYISNRFEKILYVRLHDYFTKNNLLSQQQYGFRNYHSTSLAITDLYENLLLNTDIGYKETKQDVKFEKFQSTLARHPGIERNNAHSE